MDLEEKEVQEKEKENVDEVAAEKCWNGVSLQVQVGLTFTSRSEVKKFISKFGETNNCKLVVTSGGASDGCKSRKVICDFL